MHHKIDINKYLGKWYEIATIPQAFQAGMKGVTAEYSLNEDKTIKVINSGYLNGELKQIVGTATATDKDDLFKVSFFPNIYSDYKILAIDIDINRNIDEEDWTYANVLVGGETLNSLWILSRKPKMDKELFDRFIYVADKNGYNADKLQITE